MNEIWELSTTYNMEQWKHDKMAHTTFFKFVQWMAEGREEREI